MFLKLCFNCIVALHGSCLCTHLQICGKTNQSLYDYRVHNADYYMQEAKKLKHKADALVSLFIIHLYASNTVFLLLLLLWLEI